MHCLLIASDENRADLVEWYLEDNDLAVCRTGRGEDGVDRAGKRTFDVILLDAHLPDITGPEVMKRLRAGGIRTPVVIVSDVAGVEEMSRGFGFGAAAYLVDPVAADELLACVYRVAGRARPAPFVVDTGEVKLEFHRRKLFVNGVRAPMCSKEFQIVKLLAQNRGCVFSKKDLCDHLYGGLDEQGHRVIDVYVSHARKIMGRSARGRPIIETVWGKGYRLAEPAPTEGV